MTVTNNIKDESIFDSGEWRTRKLDNIEIVTALQQEKSKGFLSFSWRSMGYSLRKAKFNKKYYSFGRFHDLC